MARRLTDRGEERRAQLLAFATSRFAEKGFHPTSVAEIVEGLGVGKGVFYWYFSSKDELLLAILRDAQRDLRRRQRHAIGDTDDPLERIARGIRASVHWLAEHRELATLVAFAATDDRFKQSVARGQEVSVGDALAHVREAIASGAVADQDPLVLSHAMFGVTAELARCFLHDRSDPPTDDEVTAIAEAAVAFCLGGLIGGKVAAATTASR